MTDLRFPIGQFDFPGALTAEQRSTAIDDIEATPQRLRTAAIGLSAVQLDTPYRAGGWTVRQVVHHLADSHINSYVRFKLALTENEPTIRPYDEARWAELDDATGSIAMSLDLLAALHVRWTHLLRCLGEEAWTRTLMHPEHGRMRVDELLAFYAWHGKHHVAHITGLRDREDW